MTGEDAIKQLKVALGVETDAKLAPMLGMTQQNFAAWRKGNLTARQFAAAIKRARSAAQREALAAAIRPVVEFFEIDAETASGGVNEEVFNVKVDGVEHPYRRGLRDALKNAHGVYVFFDSRGRALYVGKAERQSLWDEMKLAFNRDREVQMVKRVDHPTTKVPYKPAEEKRRPVKAMNVRLHAMAAYFSAYRVDPALISTVEALLIHAAANDTLNTKMEAFPNGAGRR